MKILIITILLLFGLSICAQTANPDALFLNDTQIKRLNDSQMQINFYQAKLETAMQAQEAEVLRFRIELGALPDKYEELSLIDKRPGFKRKAQPKPALDEAKP